jgi:hypothetical protein
VQPPLVEFGPYFSQQPVRQYVGHAEDILDISWSAGVSVDSTRVWLLCLDTYACAACNQAAAPDCCIAAP